MSDDSPGDVTEVKDLAGDAKSQAESIIEITDAEIQEAVQGVITAAVKRTNEENNDLSNGNGDPLPEVREQISESDLEWVSYFFKKFYDRELGAALNIADALDSARHRLSSGKKTVYKGASAALNDWDGDARDSFKDFFLDPLPEAIENQAAVLDELRAAMYAYEGVQRAGRKGAKRIAVQTTAALDSDAVGLPEAKLFLTVVGVAAWVLSSSVTGPAGVITLIGAGSFAANGVLNFDREPLEISGGLAAQILDDMVSKLDELESKIRDEEKKIADALESTIGKVQGYLNNNKDPLEKATLLPNEPNDDSTVLLTSGKTPGEDDFHPKR